MDNIKDLKLFASDMGVNSNTFDEYQKYNFRNSYIEPTVIEERSNMGSMTAISVYSRLLMDRIIFLGTEINDDVANIISAQLLWLEQQGSSDITIQISSNGGSIYDGLQIIDSMEYIKPDVSTVSMGMVASMATVIASCGTKGKRFILPHARFLVHQPLQGGGGGMKQCSDVQIQAKEIQTLKEELQQMLAENSGQSYDVIEKMCDRDTILTAKETVEYGFVDSIINRK